MAWMQQVHEELVLQRRNEIRRSWSKAERQRRRFVATHVGVNPYNTFGVSLEQAEPDVPAVDTPRTGWISLGGGKFWKTSRTHTR